MAFNFQPVDYGNAINNRYNQQKSNVNPWGQAIQGASQAIGNFGNTLDSWQKQKNQWDNMIDNQNYQRQRDALSDQRYNDELALANERYEDQQLQAMDNTNYARSQDAIRNQLAQQQLELQRAMMESEKQKAIDVQNKQNQMAIDLNKFNTTDWSDATLGGQLGGMNFDPTVENSAEDVNSVRKAMGLKPIGIWDREAQETYDKYILANNDYMKELQGLYDAYGASNVLASMDKARQEKMLEALMQQNKKSSYVNPEPFNLF